MPEEVMMLPTFVPICQYPVTKAFTPEFGEIGMLVKRGKVLRRVFHHG